MDDAFTSEHYLVTMMEGFATIVGTLAAIRMCWIALCKVWNNRTQLKTVSGSLSASDRLESGFTPRPNLDIDGVDTLDTSVCFQRVLDVVQPMLGELTRRVSSVVRSLTRTASDDIDLESPTVRLNTIHSHYPDVPSASPSDPSPDDDGQSYVETDGRLFEVEFEPL